MDLKNCINSLSIPVRALQYQSGGDTGCDGSNWPHKTATSYMSPWPALTVRLSKRSRCQVVPCNGTRSASTQRLEELHWHRCFAPWAFTVSVVFSQIRSNGGHAIWVSGRSCRNTIGYTCLSLLMDELQRLLTWGNSLFVSDVKTWRGTFYGVLKKVMRPPLLDKVDNRPCDM